MKPYPVIVLAALLSSACATTPEPAPQPTPVPAERPVTPPPAAPDAGMPIAVVPERWWLLDAEEDGVHGASVDRAYREVLSHRQPRRTVVVAIIDSGVDIEHEDLRGSLWQNPRETRNGADDDGDGLIDDVHGWNYIGGPDGRHVDDDTYEITRLFATCRSLQNGTPPRAALPPARVSDDACPAIVQAYEAQHQENAMMLMQLQQMDQAVDAITALLRQQLGTDSLSLEAVAGLTPIRNDVRQAQMAYMQLAAASITPEMIREELERVQKLMDLGLNPDFNPRQIVGDDYRNPTERVYGNADVIGPDASHGTGVAGIVAAGRGNEIGTDGIAVNVQIMTLRAVPNGDERDKDVANAIRYAVDHGANIINMSFGKAWSPEKEVVDAAVRHADERGVLLIHAAGNDAKDLTTENNFPSRTYLDGGVAQNWIEVGASDWRGADYLAATFTNYGAQHVDVFAPGSSILAPIPGNDYREASGTSFAAPVVSGIAALLMAYYPDLTVAQVRQIILDSAVPLREQMVVRPGGEEGDRVRFGDLSLTGAIVNAYRAVRMAEQLSRN
jgi:subtilisin family serine protease